MCGRYRFDPDIKSYTDIGSQAGHPVAEAAAEAIKMLTVDTTFRPYNDVPVLAEDQSGRLRLVTMYWQLIHYWCERFESTYTNFNTRRESLPKKHNRELLTRHRCLVPATSFFESRRGPDGRAVKSRESYEFFHSEGEILFLGGIYSVWKNPRDRNDSRLSCSIITLEPNEIVGEVHPRMPFIVTSADRADWLDRGKTDFGAAMALVRPVGSETLKRLPEK